jgi:CRISPR-associated endonuclease Cas2
MVLLVTYDLTKPGQEYEELYEELKKSEGWWHYLQSTWLIYTRESPKELYNRLANHLDKTDSLIIFEIKKNYYGLLPKEAWAWIQKLL